MSSACPSFLFRFVAGMLLTVLPGLGYSQTLARFEVMAGACTRENSPVKVCVPDYLHLPDSGFQLQEQDGKAWKEIPAQLDYTQGRSFWFILSGKTEKGQSRKFRLQSLASISIPEKVSVLEANGDLLISLHGKKLLQYNARTVKAPEGADSCFRRSGFIHPIWSPDGAVLTAIQPGDHHHHYGFWNPWTKTLYKGKEIDFWNLGSKQGTVRFQNFISRREGPVFGGFSALQEHVAYPDSTARELVMREVWDVRAFNLPEHNFLWEFSSTLSMAGTSPILLEEYRYGGLGIRATEYWTNKNSSALTSAGKTRKDADGSRGRWAWIKGDTEKGEAGILVMGCPSNYNFPEPIRMWPEDANNGRGDIFFNFSPTKNKDWKLEAGNDYQLKYRIYVFSGNISPERAESLWTDFANPPEVRFMK